MFGLFKRKTPVPTERPLHFKGSQEAFQFACEMLDNNLVAGAVLPGIVVSHEGVPTVARQADGSQLTRLRIASADGGFVLVAASTAGQGPELTDGDLVAWQAGVMLPELARHVSDQRSAWVGLIVAILKPEFSSSRGWVVSSRFGG